MTVCSAEHAFLAPTLSPHGFIIKHALTKRIEVTIKVEALQKISEFVPEEMLMMSK